jgi:antitoxin component HigA of HigAB toxin-antitoxin module
MSLESYRRLVAKAEKSSVIYWQTTGISEFVESLRAQMERKHIRPVDLSTKLGVSRALVSQVLNGEGNLTFATMVRFAMAADAIVHLHVADRNAVTTWHDLDGT